MSLLYRHNVGRNDIAWGGGTSTVGNYLQRTGSGRTNIRFYTIPQSNATYNLMERYNNTRNGIRWNNITFTFASGLQLYPIYNNNDGVATFNAKVQKHSTYYYYSVTVNPSSYSTSFISEIDHITGTIEVVNLYVQDPNTVLSYWRSRWTTLYLHTGLGTFSGDLSDWRNGSAYQDDHYIQFRPFQMTGYDGNWKGNTLTQISFS